jgi:acyl dehydratase
VGEAGGAIVHRLVARNTARESPNKIHDERVAKEYGFAGGLVPGVTIFAWMCGPPLDAYGERWLAGGMIEARFREPIYEGDDVTVEAHPGGEGMSIGVRTGGGAGARASGRAALIPGAEGFTADSIPPAEIPSAPPPASPETLVQGRTLGTLEVRFEAGRVRDYLASIGADHPPTAEQRAAHPGWLCVLANLALSSNVTLGPWIHVSSEMRLLSILRDGEQVRAFSRVAEEFERKGHRFVGLDVLITAEERPVASVRHVAIYAPRRPT